MHDKNLIKKVERFAKEHCQKDPEDPNLWENHVQLVREYALKLAEIERADKEVIEIAAFLHDIGKENGRINHHIKGRNLAKKFLESIDLPNSKERLILKCILKHRSRFSSDNNELEVKIIQSADALGTLFDERWQTYNRNHLSKEEMLSLYKKSIKKINLASARKIARPQIDKLKKLLE